MRIEINITLLMGNYYSINIGGFKVSVTPKNYYQFNTS